MYLVSYVGTEMTTLMRFYINARQCAI